MVRLSSEWPLVGREREKALAREALVGTRSAGVALIGDPGVGKSHLANAVADTAERSGVRVIRGFGRASLASVPLSAFAYLVPEGGTNATGLIEAAVRALSGPVGQGMHVNELVYIDDAHALDDASAEVLLRLARTRLARVLLTIRADTRVPAAVAELWHGSGLTRIDLAPVPDDAMASLISTVLEGPIDGISQRTLVNMAAGNPMFLKETMLGALDSGILVERNGRWRLTRSPASVPRLTELVASRLAALPPRMAEATELLAVSGPIEATLAMRVVDPADLEALEALGVARVEGVQPDAVIDLAHPLYADVLRERLPAFTLMRLSRALADAHDECWPQARGSAPPALVVRAARWRLDAGGVIDVTRMRAATVIAHASGDHALTERLGRAALAVEPDAETALLVSWSLGQLGRHDASLEVLRNAPHDDPGSAAMLTLRHADVLFWAYGGAAPARELCEVAIAQLPQEWSDELRAQLAIFDLLEGRPAEALAALEPLLSSEHGHVVVRAALGAAQAMAVMGRGAEAIAVADDGFGRHTRMVPPPFGDPAMHVVGRGMACVLAGHLDEAAGVAALGYDAAVAVGHGPGVGWFAMMKAWVALRQGRLLDAAADAEEAGLAWQDSGNRGPYRWSLAGVVLAHAQRGDRAATEAARRLLEAADAGAMGHLMSIADQAIAWSDALRGRLPEARRRLAAAASGAAEVGAFVPAADAWHDLLRLGDPIAAAKGFAALPPTDDPLPSAWRAHVDAWIAADPLAVAAAGERFEALGCLLWSAEAAAGAASLAARTGRRALARRLQASATVLAARCQGVSTPMLAATSSVLELTARERQVAERAAAGASNRAIAVDLGLSQRTVENHLYRVFTKLAVRDRSQLAGAFGCRRS